MCLLRNLNICAFKMGDRPMRVCWHVLPAPLLLVPSWVHAPFPPVSFLVHRDPLRRLLQLALYPQQQSRLTSASRPLVVLPPCPPHLPLAALLCLVHHQGRHQACRPLGCLDLHPVAHPLAPAPQSVLWVRHRPLVLRQAPLPGAQW